MTALCLPATAADRTAFYGTWGTAKQCAREPIKPGGSVLAEPFEISSKWLRHGQLWCRLSWGPMESRPGGLFTAAHALCGEDTVRPYFLGLILTGDDLTLRWDFPVSNGPLKRCSAP
ncbi:MAG: hypothetical protein JJ902_06545 [Roseibium sp.]|nr:hypothetical protein [Roseibium sp.]